MIGLSHVPSENEYLFAPYSVFTVVKVKWTTGKGGDPHIIELLASPDNAEPDTLVLAPWS